MIYINDNKMESIAVGDTHIPKIYKGSELVFQKSKPLLYAYNKMVLLNYELYEPEFEDLYNDYINDKDLQIKVGKALYDKYKNSTNPPDYVDICKCNLLYYKPNGYRYVTTWENLDDYSENGKLIFTNEYRASEVIPNEFAVHCDWPDGYIWGEMCIWEFIETQEPKIEDYIFR